MQMRLCIVNLSISIYVFFFWGRGCMYCHFVQVLMNIQFYKLCTPLGWNQHNVLCTRPPVCLSVILSVWLCVCLSVFLLFTTGVYRLIRLLYVCTVCFHQRNTLHTHTYTHTLGCLTDRQMLMLKHVKFMLFFHLLAVLFLQRDQSWSDCLMSRRSTHLTTHGEKLYF